MESRQSDMYWRLKVLSGPHLGAELVLSGNDYLIGSDPDCDIVLTDGSVYPRHARLRQTSEMWEVCAVEGGVLVGEESLPPGSAGRLEAGRVFALGTTHIGIGPPDYDWAGKVLPSAVLVDQISAEAGSSPEEETAEPETEGKPTDEKTATGSFPFKSWHALQSIFWVLGGVGGGLWVLLLVLGLDRGAAALPAVSEREQIERVLRDFPLREVTVRRTGNGWIVSGYCITEQERERVRDELSALPFPVSVRVRSRQGLLSAANTVIGGFAGNRVHATVVGDGAIRVEGVLSSPEQKTELLRLLKQDVPGIGKVKDHIRIFRKHLEPGDEPQTAPGSGTEGRSQEAAGQSRIRGIVLWKSGGLVILDDLVSLPLGAKVNGTWRISRIEPDRVWLKNGSRQIVRYLGESL